MERIVKRLVPVWIILFFTALNPVYAQQTESTEPAPQGESDGALIEESTSVESSLGADSIFSRALKGGFVVFACLMTLIFMSILAWAVVVVKWVYLNRMTSTSDAFIKSFWDSRSLNDLNSRLQEYPYSPAREIFRSGYAELVRGSQLKEQASSSELAISAAMDNLHRALNKAKIFERRRMEKYISLLAICASSAPFIGLFGTVVGIIGAFDGIALNRGASIDAVSQGISEALIATAFGLGAAIPAVVGYNFFMNRIRGQAGILDGFVADFLNIVERYLVTEKPKNQTVADKI